MTRFTTLKEFESHFDEMDINELRRWKDYWTKHAEQLQPKIRKMALSRAHKIDKAIEALIAEQPDG